MFRLEVKDKKNKFDTFFNYFYGVFVLTPISIILLIANILFIFNKNNDFIIQWNTISLVVLSSLSSILFVFKFLMNLKWRKKMFEEFNEIVANSKIPKKNPKVLYVYTTKNDFMSIRLLQNINQTYKNIETWVSVGDPNDKNIKEIKNFAKENNINVHIMKKLSLSKSDNLNDFLSHYKQNFDYLLIGDADVAFDRNFVETSLKLFYSDRALRLGYVSSTILNYLGKNVFTNSLLHFENEQFIIKHQAANYEMNLSPNLYSACSLISIKMLQDMGMKFPNSNLEDWYTEKFANKSMWGGVISPLSVALQAFDKNIWAHLNRIARLYTWGIKYYKNSFFKKYNPTYDKQNYKDFKNVFIGFYIVLGYIFLIFMLWSLFIYIDTILNNLYFLILMISSFINLILFIFFKIYYAKKLNPYGNISTGFFVIFYGIVFIPFILKIWFKSLFLGKYSSFDNPYKVMKNSWQDVKKNFFLLIFYFFILFIGNFLFFWYKLFLMNEWFVLLILFFNSFFGFLFLYEFSVLLLNLIGSIKSKQNKNEDNDNQMIYCENPFVRNYKKSDVRKKYVQPKN